MVERARKNILLKILYFNHEMYSNFMWSVAGSNPLAEKI